MTDVPHLTGYAFSVYTRAAQMAFAAKEVSYDYQECNPFAADEANKLEQRHPFCKVPVLVHKGFSLWETQAILDYIDGAFLGLTLMPEALLPRVRARQVMCITDNYLYRPLVRQAFSHGVFRPIFGEPSDPSEVQQGLAAAPRVLDALDGIASEGHALRPGRLCLAGCLLWPMLDYFTMLSEGQRMIEQRQALWTWVRWIGDIPAVAATRPVLPAERVS